MIQPVLAIVGLSAIAVATTYYFIKKSVRKIISKFDVNFYTLCNNRLFISYFDCKNNKHIIQSKFSSNNDLCKLLFN